MSEFEDGLDDETEEIESFDDIRDEVRDLTSEMDFAVALGMKMAAGPWQPCPIHMTLRKLLLD